MNEAKHRHQALSQVVESQYQRKSSMSLGFPSSLADENLAHEIQALKIVDSYGSRKHKVEEVKMDFPFHQASCTERMTWLIVTKRACKFYPVCFHYMLSS